MSKLYYLLPEKLRKPADILKKRLLNFGFSKYCPVCNSHLRCFKPFGVLNVRDNAQCPVCGSFERHRFFWLLLERKTNLFDAKPKRMLHIAPEKKMSEKFQNIQSLDYLSADLNSPAAMVKMDITDIGYDTDSFDAIYCSHVLEHVIDDKKALSELRRVLKPQGWMLLSVPIKKNLEVTEEDLELKDPQQRLQKFGNVGHMRNYGIDFEDKLKKACLEYDKYLPSEVVSSEEFKRYGLKDDWVFICRKACQ
jgi:predicted SAM-dependent methyltransferase